MLITSSIFFLFKDSTRLTLKDSKIKIIPVLSPSPLSKLSSHWLPLMNRRFKHTSDGHVNNIHSQQLKKNLLETKHLEQLEALKHLELLTFNFRFVIYESLTLY